MSNYQVIAGCHRPYRHSKGAINYIDTDHQTLQTLVNCLIADKPGCTIIFGSDCVYHPCLNTTQISVKSEVFEGLHEIEMQISKNTAL